jgi:hypothetical protein
MEQSRITLQTNGVEKIQDNMDLQDKVLVLDYRHLSDEYQHPKYQLWKAKDGFGLRPFLYSKGIVATCLADEEDGRFQRDHFIGVASQELVKEIFRS